MGCVQRGMVQAGRWARAWRTRAGGALSWAERNKEEQQPGARDVRRAVLVGRRAAGAGPLTVRRTAAAAPGLGGSGQSRRRGRGGANGRASARASKASRAGPLSSFLFVCLFSSVAFSFLSGWQLPRCSVVAATAAAAHRPGPRCLVPATRSSRAHTASSGGGESRPGAAGRRRRGATGRAPAAGPAECRGRRHGRRRRRRPSQQQHRASSIETTAANPPAARARETASQRLEPTSARQPPASPCVGRAGARDARSPVLGSSSSSPPPLLLLLPAADTVGRRGRHRRHHHHQEPTDDARWPAPRSPRPPASGPLRRRARRQAGRGGQRRRAAAARRRDAGAQGGRATTAAHTRRRCATRRRPSVAGARARPRTPWSAAGGGTPNRGHISHARSRAPSGPSASIIGRERAAQSKADSTSSELCLSDGASGGTGPPPPPAGLGIKAKKEVQKRRAACAAPLLKRPGTRRAERRCDPARTPCSTLRTNR